MIGKKRNVVVVLSSSDDEDDDSRGGRTRTRTRTRNRRGVSGSVTSKASSGSSSKRARHPTQSHSSHTKQTHTLEDEQVSFDALCDDFSDAFQGFRKLTDSGCSDKRELWVDKYQPRSLEELAVHKKKVEEVTLWLKQRLKTSKEEVHSHTLVITGQAGVGKSATVHVTASHLGAKLCEWDTPTPTLWQEHTHNSSSGICYISKLDEFESFVERVRKYSLLQFSSSGGSMKPVLLIDDLPLTNGKVSHGRLCNCLHILARSARIPTVILITEYAKADSPDNTTHYVEDIQSSLDSAGACKMAFNPLTVNSIKKALSRICEVEQCNASAEQIDQIAKASGGDIRHAITSLQYYCLRPCKTLSLSVPSTIHLTDKPNEFKPPDDGFTLSFGKDETLSLFHALGKFLHNKREIEYTTGSGDVFLLKERFTRSPLKMDAPEKVLHQAHGQARHVADFLYENVLDFIGEEAMDDAWAVTSYLSDADQLLATFHGASQYQVTGTNGLESVAHLAAASVAVRGVLFGNSHPGPSRWHAIRKPKLWHVEQSSRRNKNEMVRGRSEACSGLTLSDISVFSTEYKPVLKWIGHGASSAFEVDEEKMRDKEVADYDSEWTGLDDEEGEALEESECDDIEEC